MLAFAIAVVILLCAYPVWRYALIRHNRRRAGEILRWIESALSGQGHVAGIRWLAPSKFKVPLRLSCGVFHRATLVVEISPAQNPWSWIAAKVRSWREVVTFEADLDLPPSFSLEIHNFRWFARSSRSTRAERGSWIFEQAPVFVAGTRKDWQPEVACTMSSLAGSVNRDIVSIHFRRSSPQFAATWPLASLAPESPTRGEMFESIRELAASSSASLF